MSSIEIAGMASSRNDPPAVRVTFVGSKGRRSAAGPQLLEELEGELRIDHSVEPAELRFRGVVEALDPEPQSLPRRLAVRVFDLLFAIPAALFLLPVMLLVAAAVAFSSSGPLIYRSRRITRDGRYFDMFKFRSMVQNGDEVLDEYYALNPRAKELYKQHMKLPEDPRLTTVGRFLRKWSLDELPQLFNVIRGQMSIVGPRPLLEEEFLRFGEAVRTVLRVKSGMTGLWQVGGRNLLTFEERVPLDVRYARTRSLRGDLKIILRTIASFFRGNPGAF